jgi:crotonobetainyl-CoA:carnitine CoA-transferase CaiB-like acyl-CoA transferase
MNKMLEGIRIIDLGMVHAGVASGYMLGDLGADVIKIEEPVRGDSGRGMTTLFGAQMVVKDHPVLPELSNRNKRSIALDLKKEEGKEIFYKLIEKSDVFVTNFHPSILKRLGADYKDLIQHNPKIIYAICSAYGIRGPKKNIRRGYDFIGLAYSGAMWGVGERDSNEPQWIVGGWGDQSAAVFTAYGILAALYYREKTGKGQKLETSLLGSAINIQAMAFNAVGLGAEGYKRQARKRAINPMANHYRCADDEWILLCINQSDRFWHEFCAVMGLVELENDPLYLTEKERSKHRMELIEILDNTFKEKTLAEWLSIFEKSKASFAYSPINRWNDLLTDPQVLKNQYLVDFNHPAIGPVKLPGFPVLFSETPPKIQRQAPEFGEHTEEILIELCGFSWEKIAQLKELGVIN